MFLKENKKKTPSGKPYSNYLLVESVSTPKGPRHEVICSLGNLKPAPREHWLAMVRKVEAALSGQLPIVSDPDIDKVVGQVRNARRESVVGPANPGREECDGGTAGGVSIDVDRVTAEEAREAGPVHVGHQVWNQLGLDEVLAFAGLDKRACALTEILALSRLVEPGSERATRSWVSKTALPDILGEDLSELGWNTLYRHLDKLYPQRELIESQLAARERTLFNLDDSIVLYDLTSSYFEGNCGGNPQAQYGYSRDGRPDCKQVVVGLVLNGDGFAVAHEVFDGNRTDTTTVSDMLDALDQRDRSKQPGKTVVVDRGMSSAGNLAEIVQRGYHYVVAGHQTERDGLLAELADDGDWQEIETATKGKRLRIKHVPPEVVTALKTKVWEKKARNASSATAHAQKEIDPAKKEALDKKAAATRQAEQDAKKALEREELYVLCVSAGRSEKDRAIRVKQEKRFLEDVKKLSRRVDSGSLRRDEKVHEAIGRLKERYQRAGRYYELSFDAKSRKVTWKENELRKAAAETLDGSYLLKTDRIDMTYEQIWRTYTLLSRVEAAFRDMKSPLGERPIFHQTENRTQAHIFVCVLAYHLLVAIEKRFQDQGLHTSWETLRKELRTHQVVTMVLPTTDGRVLRVRRSTTPEAAHQEIYSVLAIPSNVIRPVKTWARA